MTGTTPLATTPSASGWIEPSRELLECIPRSVVLLVALQEPQPYFVGSVGFVNKAVSRVRNDGLVTSSGRRFKAGSCGAWTAEGEMRGAGGLEAQA